MMSISIWLEMISAYWVIRVFPTLWSLHQVAAIRLVARDLVLSVRWRISLCFRMRKTLLAHERKFCWLLHGDEGCLPRVCDESYSGVFWSHWWARKDGAHQENISEKEIMEEKDTYRFLVLSSRHRHTSTPWRHCWELPFNGSVFLIRDWCSMLYTWSHSHIMMVHKLCCLETQWLMILLPAR